MVLVIGRNQHFDGSRERRACWRCPLKVYAHLTHFFALAGMVKAPAEIPARYHKSGHYIFPTPVRKPYLFVRIDNSATSRERQDAFAFSFKSFTKLGGGCDFPSDYFPLPWKNWNAGMPSTGFSMSDLDQVSNRTTQQLNRQVMDGRQYTRHEH